MKTRTGYVFKRGHNFYVRWMIDGKPITKALRDASGGPITTRKEAEEYKTKVMAPVIASDEATALGTLAVRISGKQAELAKLEDQQNPPLALAQTWSEFIASPNRPDTGPDTLAVYEGQFGQFVTWMQEKHPDCLTLRNVSHDIAEEYAGHLNHGRLSSNTFNKHVRVLEMVFRVLKRKAKLEENVWEQITRKTLQTSSRRELTIEELRKVCSGMTGEMAVLFALGIYTGMRLKDCATLRLCELDMDRQIIIRAPSKTARRKPSKLVKVPLHPGLFRLLSELPRNDASGYVLPGISKTYVEHKKNLIVKIQKHFSDSGVKIHREGTGPGTGKRAVTEVGFHSFRHSLVSMCRANDTPLSVVESLVGHSNPAMTRHYTHTGEDAAGKAIAALPAMISGEDKGEAVKPSPEAILEQIRGIVENLTSNNASEKKTEILTLLSSQ